MLLTDRSTVQPPRAMSEQTPLLVPCNTAVTHTHPSVLFQTVLHARRGATTAALYLLFCTAKTFFFSTMVVAQGVFQTWLEKLTSCYSQEQLASRKATPARYTAGKCFAWVSLSGETLSTTRQTALLQDSPSQLSPSSTHFPRRAWL